MIHTATRIGPQDHGRRMTLAEFEHAPTQEGYLYELGRGRIVVSDVPKIRHHRQLDAIRWQFDDFRRACPGVIDALMGGNECKIPIPGRESERHPDLAVYLTPPPEDDYP